MSTSKENSFRAKMSRANDLLTYISGFENYSPTRPEEKIEGMKTFVTQLEEINASVSSIKDNYIALVEDRRDAFDNNDDALKQLIIQIKAAVESQYGKKSSESTSINRLIAVIRSTKVKKSNPDPTTEAGEKAARKAEKSYGSMTQVLKDIIAALSNYPDYETSNERVKIPTLKETAVRLSDLNARVAKQIQDIQSVTVKRRELYEDLRGRSQRIKSYVKGQYGVKSKEYILIKGMRF
jgi:uncharacterized protein YoxC